MIVIDDDDEDPQQAQTNSTEDEYEAEEDEQDPNCPYQSIVQDVDIDLDTEVLCLAIPSIATSSASQMPQLANTHAVIALACANGKVMVMTLPLAPPKSASIPEYVENDVNEIEIRAAGSIAHDLTVKVLPKDEDQSALAEGRSRKGNSKSDGRLLIAAISTKLSIWVLNFTAEEITRPRNPLIRTVHPPSPALRVSFHPSLRSTQLLLGDSSGAARIYDAFAARTANQRPSQGEAEYVPATNLEEPGRWLMSYLAPFASPKDNPALARRKRVLAISWILTGRACLVLLEDGEWGIWDFPGSIQADKIVEDFALHGHLGSSSSSDVADSVKQRKAGSKLAPMTPNTRKAKAENLFSGTPKTPGSAALGGISVATSSGARSGQTDESVIVWFGSDIYSIPSMQAFWQRSTTAGGGGFGSLYAPGLTHVSDINLMNENITSISQFASKSTTASGLGQMNMQRDILVSAEHRLIILQSVRPAPPARALFQQEAAERPLSRDQRMLDVGELDLGGMDRMLDDMAGDRKPRRVGFAR